VVNAGAEQGSHCGKVQILGNVEDKILIRDDHVGISAIRSAPGLFFRTVVGEDRAFFAELFQMLAAARAFPAGIHQAADRRGIPDFEFADVIAHCSHLANDLMAGNAGIDRVVPFVAGLMQVRVADAAVEDVDLHVMRTGRAAFEGKRGEGAGGGL